MKKALIFLGIILIVIFLFMFMQLFSSNKQTSVQKPQTPLASNTPSPSLLPKPSVFKETKIEKTAVFFSSRNPVNMKWLSNNEVSYVFFDFISKKNVLAKASLDQDETYLIYNPDLKFSESYWASDNSLLIYDYGSPTKSYIFKNLNSLQPLNITGHAYAWNPDSTSLFYIEQSSGKWIPKLLTLKPLDSQQLKADVPFADLSYWSFDGKNILLQKINQEELGLSDISILNINEKSVNRLPMQKSAKNLSWSPSSDKIGYTTSTGVMVYDLINKREQTVYPAQQDFISFLWLDSNNILIADTSESSSVFYLVNLAKGKDYMERVEYPDLIIKSQQYLQMQISPNQKLIALGTKKDGIWFIQNPLLK